MALITCGLAASSAQMMVRLTSASSSFSTLRHTDSEVLMHMPMCVILACTWKSSQPRMANKTSTHGAISGHPKIRQHMYRSPLTTAGQ